MRLIDADRLLRKLRFIQGNSDGTNREADIVMDCAIEAVESSPTAKKVKQFPEWISVEDRLPEVPKDRLYVDVLALYWFGDYWFREVRRYSDGKEEEYLPKGWHDTMNDFGVWRNVDYSAGLKYWIPLPDVPPVEARA